MALILASGSPRRRELLAYITDAFTVRVSDCEEKTDFSQPPELIVKSLAKQKGEAVIPLCSPDDTVISADTVVFIDGKILGKPKNAESAKEMLSTLSGRTHTVFTGVFINSPNGTALFADKTEVEFNVLSDSDIADYIATGEPFDKAGAYGIQGKGALLVKGITGDFYNVMGFPVARVYRELKRLKAL